MKSPGSDSLPQQKQAAEKTQPLLDPVDGATVAVHASSSTSGEVAQFKGSCVRWWILFLYCLLAICQAGTWNVFSPIYPAVDLAFPSWSSSYLNWLINSANFSFGIMLFPTPILISKLGPRVVTIGSACAVLLGAALRVLPLEDGTPLQVVMVISMVLNGVGGQYLCHVSDSAVVGDSAFFDAQHLFPSPKFNSK